MGERERHIRAVERYMDKYRSVPSEIVRHPLNHFETALYPEARIALRRLLEEREHGDGDPID